MKIPFVDLQAQYRDIKSSIDKAISQVIKSTKFIQGPDVELFEKEFARYLGVKYCIGLNSGTDALVLGIRALRLKPGDEIILPVNTFYATAIGVTENNLTPVFVDIDHDDHGISLSDLKKKITKKTKAIIAVHLYGMPDKLDEIRAIIRDSGQHIHLIEDACQAHGAVYKNTKVGGRGVFSAFSFYPGKNLGAYGDGGAIVTNNYRLYQEYRKLREYGQEKKYFHLSLGINSRLDSLQAAVLRVKLRHLDTWNSKRQRIAEYYNKKLQVLSKHIKVPMEFSDRKSVYHLYVIEVDKKRDELVRYLNEHGIGSLIHYPVPLHLQKAFNFLGYKKGDFPNAEKRAKTILSLPIFPELKKSQIDTIVSIIEKFYL